MSKILFFDIETGSLDKNGALLQLSGIIDINGKVMEEFDFFIKPFVGDIVTDEALKINHIKREDIENFEEPLVVKEKLFKIFDKYINKYDKNDKFITFGYNNNVFDFPMFINWFEKLGEKYLGSYINYKQRFDLFAFIMNMRTMKLLPESKNTKLSDVCEEYEIELNNAHSALSDIVATRLLTYKLARIIKHNLKGEDVF